MGYGWRSGLIVPDGQGNAYIGGRFNAIGPASGKGVILDGETGEQGNFRSKINGEIKAVVPDGSGGWYVGGFFSKIGEVEVPSGLAHILASGTVIPLLDYNKTNLGIQDMAVSGNDLYFSTYLYDEYAPGGVGGTYVFKMNAQTNAIDASFTPVSLQDASLVLKRFDSYLYIGGFFRSINGVSDIAYFGRVNATTGELDESFVADADAEVDTIVFSGSDMYVGGYFNSIGGENIPALVKVDTDTGVVDSGFDAQFYTDAVVNDIVISGNSIYAAGYFAEAGGYSRLGLVKLDKDTGSVDTAFDASIQRDEATCGHFYWNYWDGINCGSVDSIALSESGEGLYVAGNFGTLSGESRNGIALVDAETGALDMTFDAHPSYFRYGDSQKRISVSEGSVFFGAKELLSLSAIERRDLAKINLSTGEADPSFNANIGEYADSPYDWIRTMVLSGSELYVGGSFDSIGGQLRESVAKLNASTGALDVNFDAASVQYEPQLWPHHLGVVKNLVLSGNDLFASGQFTSFGGGYREQLAKVNAETGVLDDTFNAQMPALDSEDNAQDIYTIAIHGSSLYVGGLFEAIGGVQRNNIAKLDTVTGNGDSDFLEADDLVETLLVSGSDMYAGGRFNVIGGGSRHGLVKINLSMENVDYNFLDLSKIGSLDFSALALSGDDLYVGTNSFKNPILEGSVLKIFRVQKDTGSLDTHFNYLSCADGGIACENFLYSNSIGVVAVSGNNLLLGGYLNPNVSDSGNPYEGFLGFKLLPRVVLDPVHAVYDAPPLITGIAKTAVGGPALASVEFRDGVSGSWHACEAQDGDLDEAEENIVCDMSSLSDGFHTLYVRATDSEGYVTDEEDYAQASFTLDTSGPLSNLDSKKSIDGEGNPFFNGYALSVTKQGYTESQKTSEYQGSGVSQNWKADNHAWEYTFTDGMRFPLYDTIYDKMYVSSNGRICFGSGDSDVAGFLSNTNCGPFIAPFWGDIDTTNGDVSLAEDDEGVTVNWDGTYADADPVHGTTSEGTAKGWQGDENLWEYTLPFSFPFYGNDYTTAYVSANGKICFEDGVDCNGPLIEALPLDLITNGSNQSNEDIYITENADNVVIRWRGEEFSNGITVNFEVVLYADGRIRFNYGDFNGELWSGRMGVGKSYDSETYVFSRNSVLSDFNEAFSTLFSYHSANDTYEESLIPGVVTPTPVRIEVRLQKDGTVRFSYGDTYDFSSSANPPVIGISKGDGSLYTSSTDAYFEEGISESGVSSDGIGQGSQEDDAFWVHTLPFSFPFYEDTYTNVMVTTNGRICFWNDSTGYSGNLTETDCGPFIAPLFTDLVTNGSGQSDEDVYITDNADNVIIRWRAEEYGTGTIVNFEAVLYSDGRIRFNYGDFGGELQHTYGIGISKGDGSTFSTSGNNSLQDLDNAFSKVFFNNNIQSSKTYLFTPNPLGTIQTVEYQLDGTSGSWIDCDPRDGSFNTFTEAFACYPGTVSDGTHTLYAQSVDSGGNSGNRASYVFSVGSDPPVLSPSDSLLSASPNPTTPNTPVTITLTTYDTNANPMTAGGATVSFSVSGSNTTAPTVTDNNDGTYTATYTPTNTGTDQITAIINTVSVTKDTDGTSDGTYHLSITGNLPPVLSNGSPMGTLPSGTTQTTLSLDSNENATCKYSTTPNTDYDAMTDTFAVTESTHHTQDLTGLADSSTYHYYIRCIDEESAKNTSDYEVTFSVGVSTPDLPSVSLFVAPSSLSASGNSILTWSSSNADTCVASEGWSGTKTTSGSETIGVTQTTTFTLTCTGSGGSGTDSVQVIVTSEPTPEPEEKDHLTLIESKNDILTFDALISKDREEQEDISSKEDQDTSLQEVKLKADNQKIDGQFEVEKQNHPKITLPKKLLDRTCSIFSQVKITTDSIDKDSVKRLTLSYRIPEKLRKDLQNDNFFIAKRKGDAAVLLERKGDSSSSFTFENEELEGTFTLLDCVPKTSDIPDTPKPPVTPIQPEPENPPVPPTPPTASVQEEHESETREVKEIPKEQVLGLETVAVPALILSGILFPLLELVRRMGSSYAFWLLLKEVLQRLLGFFAWRTKRGTDWGTVYDVATGKPLPLTVVSIMDAESGKVREQRLTDSLGSYAFLVSPGSYTLEPEKEHFVKVEKNEHLPSWYEKSYNYQALQYKEYARVDLNLPMEGVKRAFSLGIMNGKALFFSSIFYFGFLFNLYAFVTNPGFWNGIMIFVYILLELLRRFGTSSPKWGTVTDALGKVQSFAIVQLLDGETRTLIARSVTDEKGRYHMIANPGRYILSTKTVDGSETEVSFSLKQREAVKADMVVEGERILS